MDMSSKFVLEPRRYEKTSGAAPNLKIRVRAGARAKLPLEIAQDLKTEANEHFSASMQIHSSVHAVVRARWGRRR